MNKIIFKMLALVGWVFLPLFVSAAEEVPHYVNFQAVLRDDSGNLITDASVDLEFKILDQAGNQIYYEQQPGVQVVRSSVNVMIGEGINPGSDPAVPTGGVPPAALDPASGEKKLQIQFGSNQPSDPMALGSVPYAVYAEKALGLDASIKVTDIPSVFATDDEVATAVGKETADRTAADTVLQTAINNETSNRTTADSALQSAIDGKVSKSGDTMTGNLTMNANVVMQSGRTVDGVDVSSLQSQVDGHESRIAALEGGMTFGSIGGQVSESQVPQYMRPFAFGVVIYDGSAGNNWPLQSGGYNVSASSGTGACTSITFQNAAPSAGYIVQVSSSPASAATSYFRNKSASGFDICVSSIVNPPEMDFLVFGNF